MTADGSGRRLGMERLAGKHRLVATHVEREAKHRLRDELISEGLRAMGVDR